MSIDELDFLAKSFPELAGDVLEVGCWKGLSTSALAQRACKRITVVDIFQKSPEYEQYWNEDVYNKFKSNMESIGAWEKLEVLRGQSGEMLPKLIAQNRKFDFILVDASHKYEDVRRDVDAAKRLLNKSGVIVCDDYFISPKRVLKNLLNFRVWLNGVSEKGQVSKAANGLLGRPQGRVDKMAWWRP